MIPARFVTAWFPHAQWRSMAQVEQDLLLVQAMHAIFTDAFLSKHVAMRGGTVLHKVHLAPAMRYSEDINSCGARVDADAPRVQLPAGLSAAGHHGDQDRGQSA